MSSAAIVAAVGALSRSSASHAVTPALAVSGTQPAKNRESARKTVTMQAANAVTSSTPSIVSQVPLGLLLSVGAPPSGNVQASSDYVDMQDALRADNLVAAQQAYRRLQSDLVLNLAEASAMNTGKHALNAVA